MGFIRGVNMIIIGTDGKEQNIDGCLGCACASGEFDVFGGNLFETESFILAQDCELPINGFLVISSKRHITQITELSEKEQVDLMKIINKALKVLKAHDVAEEYNIVLEEKSSSHFHVWLMPRHKWMLEKFGKVMKNLKPIFDYSLENLRTKESLDEILKTCEIVKNEMKDFKI